MLNSLFTTISGHFCANCMKIFHKIDLQTVILRCWTSLNHDCYKSYDTKHKKHKNSKNTNLTKLVNSCKNIFKYFQAFLWILQWKSEIQRPNISHFKAFDIRNSEYGTRNPQKIYNRAAITERIHYKIHLNRLFISSQDSLYAVSKLKRFFQKQSSNT